jgi:hypothetical protein
MSRSPFGPQHHIWVEWSDERIEVTVVGRGGEEGVQCLLPTVDIEGGGWDAGSPCPVPEVLLRLARITKYLESPCGSATIVSRQVRINSVLSWDSSELLEPAAGTRRADRRRAG